MNNLADYEVSFAELYGEALLDPSFSIILHKNEVQRCKVGLKNFKSHQARKAKEAGLAPDYSLLVFEEKDVPDDENLTELSITVRKQASIIIKRPPKMDLDDIEDEE